MRTTTAPTPIPFDAPFLGRIYDSIAEARRLARTEGVSGGISSGAALAATLKLARRPEMAGRRIVMIIPSSAERSMTTALFEGLDG